MSPLGFTSKNSSNYIVHHVLTRPIMLTYLQTDGVLKPEVIAILTAAKYYIKAYCCIFPSASLSLCATESGEDGGKYTFWPLIHALGRHGVYAVEEGGHNVNHTTLAQTNPFREVHTYSYLIS